MSFSSHLLPLSLLSSIILCNSMFHSVEAESLDLDTDKEALISFRSQISLQSPNPLSSWNTNTSPCNWTGIICNSNGLRVISVNLPNLRLAGSLSPHIGNLSFLQSLELQNNQLSGPIPDQISNLFRLQVLNLSTNSLQGSIPLNVTNLSNLRLLDLTMNKITGKIPEELSLLTRLQVLNLGKNSFSGWIPPSLSNLSSLVELSLATNSISGMIPSDLGKLRNLKVLDLMLNNLTGTVPSTIYNMTSLENFAIASNQFSGTIPRNVGDTLPNLDIFNNCFNKFTGTIPGSLHNITNIRVIRMAGNLLEGTVPPGLGNLPLLEMYNIGFNNIVNSGDDNGLEFISSLTNSTRLQFLAIDGNLLRGKIPESVGNLSKDLQWLYMGGNQIYGEIPASIGRLSSLNLLNLSHNAITGVIPPGLGELVQLKELGLAGNQISGGIPDSLGNLKNLNLIDLSGNKLEGQIPTTFGNFHRLQTMDLSNNRINNSIPKEILSLSSLSTILNLSHNFLSGDLSLMSLESVDTIDLSRNNLSGNIPGSISNCKSLQNLFLSYNMFSGIIPRTLGEVMGLETVDLSHNKLSGPIPSELENLQASLNLSFNNLEGPLPCGGVFSNPAKAQLEGNPELLFLSASACKNISSTPAQNRVKVGIIIAIICAAIAFILVVGSLFYLRNRKQKKIGASQVVNAHQSHLVSYEELRGATENFKEENLLGTGGFGSVFKGCLRDGSVVAIKVLDNFRTGSWKSFVAECEALRNVRHRNLVKLITSCSSLDHKNMEFLALIYEFLSHGSLDEWIHGKRTNENEDGLNILERLNIAIDVASALDYLHNDYDFPVVHCDLKPSNILLDDNMTAKVGDFGLARLLIEKIDDQTYISSTHVLKGSIGYIPPEYGFGSKPSTEGDTYSYGILLLELFTGKSPTHDCFTGEENLQKCVQSAFPTNVSQVTDSVLLSLMENLYHDGESISIETQIECIITILGVGLSCTVISPEGRIRMRDALGKLKAARTKLLGYGYKKEALLEFKSLLLGDNVTETEDLQGLETWNTSKCCEWDRVFCDSETNTHVTTLDFTDLVPSLALKTVVKADVLKPLCRLRTLEELNLGNNDIHGEIPEEIGNLTSLTWFAIFDNSFSGSIPSSILKLSKLYHFDVSDNFLSMEIPSNIGNLSHMSYLSFGGNNFSGAIPSSIQNMQQLEYLSFHDNSLSGEVPAWLFSLEHMKHLSLSTNLNLRFDNFSTTPRSMIENLMLSSCNIAARIPTWISNQTALKILDLENCGLTGTFPRWLAKLESLEALTLSGNSLSGTLPRSVFNMPRLMVLDLSCNRFSGSEFPALSPHSPLLYLNLSHNMISRHIPLPLAPRIEALVLSHNAISGVSLRQNASSWTRLKWLDLHDNNIAGEIPKFLSRFSSLQFLNLRNNCLQGTIPVVLSKLKNLKVLDLSDNKLTGKIPFSLPSLNRKNGVAEELSVAFSTKYLVYDLGNFEVLWKRSKQSLFGNYVYMYGILDLSNNKLSGKIPDTLGDMEGLKSLNLSNNNLSGIIPRSIGNLQNLESLDLSRNKLSGKIPDTFSKLLQLNNLDVSNNKLAGRIPEGPQMDRLNDPSWYAINSGLCGVQIQVPCTEASPYVNTTNPTQYCQESIWFSWIMAGIAYPFAFLSTVLYLYLTNFFRIRQQRLQIYYKN